MGPPGQPSSLFSHGDAKDDFVVLDRTDFDYKDPDEKPQIEESYDDELAENPDDLGRDGIRDRTLAGTEVSHGEKGYYRSLYGESTVKDEPIQAKTGNRRLSTGT